LDEKKTTKKRGIFNPKKVFCYRCCHPEDGLLPTPSLPSLRMFTRSPSLPPKIKKQNNKKRFKKWETKNSLLQEQISSCSNDKLLWVNTANIFVAATKTYSSSQTLLL